jgi:hypothetical protein
MNPASAKLAATLARHLGKYAQQRASDLILGPPEQRALRQACERAIQRAVSELSSAGMESDQVNHVLSLTERLLDVEIPDGRLMDLVEGSGSQLPRWRSAVDAAGLDPTTFPVNLDKLIRRLLSYIPEECQRVAAKPGSALFNSVVVTNLQTMSARIQATLTQLQNNNPARFLPLAPRLERRLDAAREQCRASSRPFYTADLLLALLADSQIAACFNTVRPGLGERLKSALEGYVRGLKPDPARPYFDFGWAERDDVRQAQRIAWQADAVAVSAPCLLLGMLDTISNTQAELITMLGQDLRKLKEITAHARDNKPFGGTPGSIFGGGNDQ